MSKVLKYILVAVIGLITISGIAGGGFFAGKSKGGESLAIALERVRNLEQENVELQVIKDTLEVQLQDQKTKYRIFREIAQSKGEGTKELVADIEKDLASQTDSTILDSLKAIYIERLNNGSN